MAERAPSRADLYRIIEHLRAENARLRAEVSTTEQIDSILAPEFAGVLVSDFYAAYHHLLGAPSARRAQAARRPPG